MVKISEIQFHWQLICAVLLISKRNKSLQLLYCIIWLWFLPSFSPSSGWEMRDVCVEWGHDVESQLEMMKINCCFQALNYHLINTLSRDMIVQNIILEEINKKYLLNFHSKYLSRCYTLTFNIQSNISIFKSLCFVVWKQ